MREKDFLKKMLPRLRQGAEIAVGPGDDCAVIDVGKKDYLLFAVDQLVADVHFILKDCTPESAGRKLLKRNLSDIAAMGGLPSFALLTVAAKFADKVIDARWLDKFFAGIEAEAEQWGISICGGDISSTRKGDAVFTLSIAGRVEKKKLCLRSGAQNADILFCTGRFGNSYKSGHHIAFVPRIREARFLSGDYTNTMIDVSDGLLSDAAQLSSMSGCGIRLDVAKIPMRKGADLQMAQGEGEDYELLFAASPRKALKLKKKWPFKDVSLTEIGVFSSGVRAGKIFDGKNDLVKKISPGYDHFTTKK